MVRGCHPMRLSPAAARLRSFVAARARIVFWRLTSRAIVAAPGTRPREGAVSNSTALTSVTRPSTRRDQPADKCQGALCGLRSVDTDDDRAYALRPPDHEYRALGATDDASGDAAHEQATNGAMPAPADHDHIGLKTFGFAENSLNWGLVQDFNFDVGPAARECPPCALRRLLGAAIERASTESTVCTPPGFSAH